MRPIFWDIFLNGELIDVKLWRGTAEYIKMLLVKAHGYNPNIEVKRSIPWWEVMEWGGSGI